MNIHRIGMYLIPLESWEGAEYCTIDRVGIGHLVVEESGLESKDAREVSSLNIYRTGTYLTLLESREGAEHCPIDRVAMRYLVMEVSGVESKSAGIDTSLITEADSMAIHHVGT